MTREPRLFHDGDPITATRAGEIARDAALYGGIDLQDMIAVFTRALCYRETTGGGFVYDPDLDDDGDSEDARDMFYSWTDIEIVHGG